MQEYDSFYETLSRSKFSKLEYNFKSFQFEDLFSKDKRSLPDLACSAEKIKNETDNIKHGYKQNKLDKSEEEYNPALCKRQPILETPSFVQSLNPKPTDGDVVIIPYLNLSGNSQRLSSPETKTTAICKLIESFNDIVNAYEDEKKLVLEEEARQQKLADDRKRQEEEQLRLKAQKEEAIKRKQEEELLRRRNEELTAKKKEEERLNNQNKIENTTTANIATMTAGRADVYKKYMDMLEKIRNELQDFMKEEHIESMYLLQKMLRTNVRKIARLSINTIPKDDLHKSRDTLLKLDSLFSGKDTTVGDIPITNTSRHPKGRLYAYFETAKAFIEQGGSQISSTPSYGFIMAAIAIGICSQHPDFKEILLGMIYQACPFLLPFCPSPSSARDETDYLKSLGYKVTDGKVEDQKYYLKRITGIIRFYACLAVSPVPNPSLNHPFSLENLWILLATMSMMSPIRDISAGIVHEVLVDIGEEGASFTRLKVFLEIALTKMEFNDPVGILSSWN
ncbi:DgyrCDS8526 [Dimorphilus gyrociliatus]|uniref:mRNA export factor GLE1 n=1 Tax=Dimorphilus gyrociliatus TaxID=2664684 RepID=A0A7I8VW42_9ANNE|nr:DgyrCDS8526 [Dimorphilus gyrociliatus]